MKERRNTIKIIKESQKEKEYTSLEDEIKR